MNDLSSVCLQWDYIDLMFTTLRGGTDNVNTHGNMHIDSGEVNEDFQAVTGPAASSNKHKYEFVADSDTTKILISTNNDYGSKITHRLLQFSLSPIE